MVKSSEVKKMPSNEAVYTVGARVGRHLYDRTYTTVVTEGWFILNGRTVNGFISFPF